MIYYVVLCYNGFEIVNSNNIQLCNPTENLHVSCMKFVANYNALNRFIHCMYTGCICNAWTNFKSQFFESKRSINLCPEMSVFLFSFMEIEYLNCVVYYLQLTYCICSKCYQLNNCCVRIVYQVTVHNKRSKCPTAESMRTRTRLIVNCRTLSELPRAVANGLTGPKSTMANCFFILN